MSGEELPEPSKAAITVVIILSSTVDTKNPA